MKQEGVPTRAVIFGSAIDEGETVEAVRLGVRGIVLKEMPRSF
jgi:DNA-binding NarL/FixJ family response regulator